LLVLIVAILSFAGIILKLIEASIKNGDSAFVVNYFVIIALRIVGQFTCYLILRKLIVQSRVGQPSRYRFATSPVLIFTKAA